jgi:ubiquinone/menaquinone biosynthesis C-methylase UbiE
MDKNQVAVAIFDLRADGYQDKFMNVDLYGSTFDSFCSLLQKNAAVLEIACGPGNITRHLLDKRPDLKIMGTDLAPNMINLAKANNPEAEFKLMDCRNMGAEHKTYDALMAGFCLPYLSKEEAIQLISDAYAILNSGGAFYLSTMEDDYSKSGLRSSSYGDQMFMHYHEAGYLTAALSENGFKIISLERIETAMQDGSKVVDLVIIAQK